MYLEAYTNEKIRDLRRMRKLRIEDVADATGISKSALDTYEKNEDKDISHRSIIALAKFYGVTTDYLLGLTENRNEQLTPVEELRLDDETIDMLKNRRINNRLFCEMAKHPGFNNLLADIEIYIDGIASSQIRNLNAYVDAARAAITKEYDPNESDQYMNMLQAAHVNEEEYFLSRIHEDIDHIISDLKEEHKNDSASAPKTSAIDEVKAAIQEASEFHGSADEKKAIIFCKQLGINYSKLTPEEFLTLTNILSKSSAAKYPISQRGKKSKK